MVLELAFVLVLVSVMVLVSVYNGNCIGSTISIGLIILLAWVSEVVLIWVLVW